MSETTQQQIIPLTPSRKVELGDELVADLTLYKALLEEKKKKTTEMNTRIKNVATAIEELRQELRKPVVLDFEGEDEQEAA